MIGNHARRASRPALAIATALALAVVLAACGGGGDGGGGGDSAAAEKPTIVLGTKNFPEQFVLGQLYRQALEAKGYRVVYKENIGSTELIHTALENGEINMYPEYTGVIVQVVFHHDLSAENAEETYQLAKELEAEKGVTVLDRTPFSDTDAIAVLNGTAQKYGLRSVADLKKVPNLTLGGFPEFETRNTGLVGLKRAYGIDNVKFVPLAGISAYAALDSGKVLAADVFTTDPPLGPNSKYTVLDDPKNVFGFQNVAPLVLSTVADAAGQEFADTVNGVSALLTNQAIIAMNRAVIVDKRSAAAVAKEFLQQNGLV